MEIIQSRENKLVKEIRKLRERKYRKEKGMFLIEGYKFFEEALKSKFEMTSIIVCEDEYDKFLNNYHIDSMIKVYVLKKSLFKEVSSSKTPQGIAAILKVKDISPESIESNFYVLLDRVQDPGNLGTIIRTAHAVKAKGVILTRDTVDIYNEKTISATMGSIFHVPVIEDNDLSFVKSLKDDGYNLVASSLKADNNFFEENLKRRIIIAVGNEGNGISDEIYSLADVLVKIPMPGGSESLNAAVSASVMMYETLRQNW